MRQISLLTFVDLFSVLSISTGNRCTFHPSPLLFNKTLQAGRQRPGS
jgi:hypothetical protein